LPAIWKKSLHLLLNQQRAEAGTVPSPGVAVLGVGNPMCSDDAAGVLVARALSGRECASDTERVLIIESGHAPENRTGELRRFAPDIVLIIDAADMGETPGTIQWIPEESIDGMSASTHSLPLSMLAHYLRMDLGCSVMLLGIQIHSNEIGENVSGEVLQAVNEIVDELDQSLCRRDR
jgi:hydrogenase 3 maturation protease